MTRFSLPVFRTPKHRQIIDQESAIKTEENELPETCSFMPQSPAPAMFASATQGSQKRLDIRALRLLSLSPQTYDGDSENVDAEERTGTVNEQHQDINEMPKTPPLTPSTPNTDSSFSYEEPCLSFAKLTRMLPRSRSTAIPVWPSMLLLALVVFAATILMTFGTDRVTESFMEYSQMFMAAVAAMSDGLEIAIEGFGWMCGRAVGRFGRGFSNGYRL